MQMGIKALKHGLDTHFVKKKKKKKKKKKRYPKHYLQ